MTAAQSDGTTRCAIAVQFLTMAVRSMVRMPPVSSSGGPDGAPCSTSGDARAGATGLIAADAVLETAASVVTAWLEIWSGAGKPSCAATDVCPDGASAGLNLAFNL